MNIEEIFNEKRNKAINMMSHRDDMPQGVTRVIIKIKNKIEQISKEKGIDFESIRKNIETQFDTFIRSDLRKIGEERKDRQINKIIQDLNQLESALENEKKYDYILEEKKCSDEKEAMNTTERILNMMEYTISNIVSRQRVILNARNYSKDIIDEISYEIRDRMKRFMRSDCETELNNELNRDNLEVRQFEKKLIEEIEKATTSQNPDNREQFKEELKAGAPSMEEQVADARNRADRAVNNETSEKEKEGLPNEILQ